MSVTVAPIAALQEEFGRRSMEYVYFVAKSMGYMSPACSKCDTAKHFARYVGEHAADIACEVREHASELEEFRWQLKRVVDKNLCSDHLDAP